MIWSSAAMAFRAGVVLRVAAMLWIIGVLALPRAQAGNNPLDDLIAPVTGKSACFRRDYDNVHLRRHAKQKTTSMVVWLKYEDTTSGQLGLFLGIAIRQRGDSQPFFGSGGCSWGEGFNRDIQGRRLIKTYKKDTGVSCDMSAIPDVFDTLSAEEGGNLILDAGKIRDSLLVYLDESLNMVKRSDRAKPLYVKFGADDQIFQLLRADAKDCDFVERALSR
jgi:hypothetical protein